VIIILYIFDYQNYKLLLFRDSFMLYLLSSKLPPGEKGKILAFKNTKSHQFELNAD